MSKEKKRKGLREFGLTTFAVDNGTSIFLLTFMILLFGAQSYNHMPKEAFPEVPWPKIYVNTVYFGNSAKDIENLVTRPIEKELATISELKTVTSSSLQDYSLIVAEFDADIDLDDAARKVKDAVDKAKPELPNDLTQEPEVLKINLSELPVMVINISGNYNNDELREYAEYLQEKIEDLKEISQVDLKGDLEREVRIDVDIPKMESLQVSFGDIENAIRSENITMSGGELLNNEFRRTIRVLGEFNTIQELENVIIKSENALPVYLRDIASVKMGFKDQTSIARADGFPVISLDIIKESGENLLSAAAKIRAEVADAQEKVFPSDLKVSIFNDLSIQTQLQVSNLENSIISGVILVIIILMFFLGVRNALFVGLAIPLSMLMGILILNIIGYTLNIVVLFALILALGLLVDNAIVVVENIYRYMQNGYSGLKAAKYGAGEVALPIIASTATTLAAFLPLAFWPGLIGSFMKFLPVTLIIVLSSSLFVALVINPVFTSSFMKVDIKSDDKMVRRRKTRNVLLFTGLTVVLSLISHLTGVNWLRNALGIVAGITLINYFVLRDASFFFQNHIIPVLETAYDHFIRAALNKFMPGLVFGGTFILLLVATNLLMNNLPKVDLFPDPDPNYVNAFVELPIGMDIAATDKVMKDLEQSIEGTIEPYKGIVEAVLSQIGENTSDPNAGPAFGASPNKARLTVSFVPGEKRGGVSTFQVMEEIREGIRGIPGVQIVVDKDNAGPPQGKPINIELQGDNIDSLAVLSERLMTFIDEQNIGGIEELKADVTLGKPEMEIYLDREAARRFEISTFGIADAVRTAVFGKEISQFKEGEDEYPIMLRVKEKYRNNISDILNQKITFRSPANGQISQVPISTVADIKYSSTYTSINRKNQERMITIYSNVIKGYNANEVVAQIKEALNSFVLPEGYSLSFTGQQETMAEETAFLSTAFTVALFIIFIILVAQFNSIVSPFIILISILFSTIGVFLGYVITGMDILIVMTGVGIISLAGIVVNNAIVLIDYINLLVKRKLGEFGLKDTGQLSKDQVKEAIILGGATRLRPVLLTAITTVLGLIPLAIGFNFDFAGLINNLDPNIYYGGDNAVFWGTMAWTVIYGLVFSTFLTLIVVPVMYWLAYRLKYGIIGFWSTKSKSQGGDYDIELAEQAPQ